MYNVLHPEDPNTTENDCIPLILEKDSTGNDNILAFITDKKGIILVESQPEESENIAFRSFLHLSTAIEKYLQYTNQDLDQVEPVKLPCWEIYALVANSKNTEYDEYLFDDSHHEKSSFMNMKVRLLRARNKNDIVDQYTKFTEIYEHQYIIYDDNRKTISETIRICKERGILKDYLERHEHELVSMYEALYNERNALEFEMYQERL